jgi:hypothetical protein
MGRPNRRSSQVLALAVACVVVGGGGSAGQSSPTPVDFGIVGEWLGLHDCEQIVPMLREGGLEEFVAESVIGNGLVPGVTDPADFDVDDPCADAVPRSHSHFFTDTGAFGSRDHDGNQVDDGSYTVDGDTVTINGITFGFAVAGDALTLVPGEPESDCTTQECRFGNAWRLMVSLPGTTWIRVP